jgi:putative membrane protein
MGTASQILTAVVAALHVYFLVLESFLWTTPIGQKTFARTAAQQLETKSLAQNQGLYNGFLAAGLVWSLIGAPVMQFPLRVFFLGCVVIAGIVGAVTASKKILFVQALPAALALVVTYLASR